MEPVDGRAEGHLAPGGRRLVVGAAIVRGEGPGLELLAARRSDPPELAGGWELPGGKVEPGEVPAEALRRELREELGVAVDVGPEVPGPDDGLWPLGEAYALRVWVVRLVGAAPPAPLEQHDELRWVRAARWRDVAWLPGDVAPVAAAVEALAVDVGPGATDPGGT
jgi:8-oxo-dGTP diphosphatase